MSSSFAIHTIVTIQYSKSEIIKHINNNTTICQFITLHYKYNKLKLIFFKIIIISELRATMRAWLFVLAVLATFKPIVQVASTDKRNKQQIDPVALEQFEKTLLNQLGIEKRPKIIDRSKIVIPDELKEVFNQMMMGHEDIYSVNLPIAGKHTKSANTIRSFAHEGEHLFF